MGDREKDALVEQLVAEFEVTKLAGITARERYLTLMANGCADTGAAFFAQRSWLRLETVCQDILSRIDQMAESDAA